MEIRAFNIREADWDTDGKQLSNIRRLVFIVEQQVPREEEWDGRDEESWHWLATDVKDVPIGTARLLPDGQIGRMAVLPAHRERGVGAALLEQAVEKARHLGFTRVYLNAQTHARGFYERGGFAVDGDEFMEAGIAHIRMTRNLDPPVDNIQRLLPASADLAVTVKRFDTAEVTWSEASRLIRRVRRRVFDTEFNAAEAGADDDEDEQAIHWVATNQDDHVIGVIRMTPAGVISHFAVLDDYRRQGVGSTLLELALNRARRFSLDEVSLQGLDAPDFLEKKAFSQQDGKWRRHIDPEDTEVERLRSAGEAHNSDLTYLLGEDKQLILLRQDSDFRNVIIEMARQARQWIRIYSPVLSHDLFDQQELVNIVSRLARRNRYTHVEMLVFDPHRIVKNGHGLLTIARKLPSSIGIKVVDPEMRQQNHEYMLVDGCGVIYRQEYETYEGTACFNDVTECNRLNRQFTASWESGILDPNLRQLRI